MSACHAGILADNPTPSVPPLTTSSQVPPDFERFSRHPPEPSHFCLVGVNPRGESSRGDRGSDPLGSAIVHVLLSLQSLLSSLKRIGLE